MDWMDGYKIGDQTVHAQYGGSKRDEIQKTKKQNRWMKNERGAGTREQERERQKEREREREIERRA
jgi:membrane protein involved in colicin uptake